MLSIGVAILLLFRESRSVVRDALVSGLVVLSAEILCVALSLSSLLPEHMLAWQRVRLFVAGLIPGPWILFSLTYSRGNWRDFMRRWRLAAWPLALAPILVVIVGRNNLVTAGYRLVESPSWRFVLGGPSRVLLVLLLLSFVVVLMNLERTLRNAVGTMRWRIKYMIMGVGFLLAVRLYSGTQALLYGTLNVDRDALNAGALLLGALLILRSAMRGRLLDVDIYLSQKALFRSITVLAIGAYLLMVGGLGRLVQQWGGAAGFPASAFLLFLALAVLTVMLLSDRTRQRLKILVNRHLRRPHYDYREVWATFTSRTASIMDVSVFCRAVTELISETLDVLSVTIWLTDTSGNHLRFGGSTALSQAQARELAVPGTSPAELLRALEGRDRPFDIDNKDERGVEAFQRFNPDWFKKGGHRVCVPLRARGEWLGIMTLGDRVEGLPYTMEEMDLLKVVGEQAAATLLNIRLSERLLQAKQLEAFQAMSTFFVHDLKNTSSSLSLMLQNLPKHFANPDFRADAFKAMTDGVGKINDLIRRLTVLRQKLEVHPTRTNLNDVAAAALEEFRSPEGIFLKTVWGESPDVMADAEQIRKVLINLLLNARDAVGPGGEITLATGRDGDWATVSVTDNGCGMAPEFMDEALFRPFQSTKKDGMGIGLFHSRLILDAHGGQFDVTSKRGEGSTFCLRLPLQGGSGGQTPHRG